MTLTKNFRETVQARAERDSSFRIALFQEGIESLLAGDVDTGKAVLHDYIDATVGFNELEQVFDKSSSELMHMFGPNGDLRIYDLFPIIQNLQKHEGIRLEVSTRKMV